MSRAKGSTRWSIALTALAGAWLGHFVEYVRVAGWQSGLADMGSSVHTYFFPAGAALMAILVGVAAVGGRAWRALGKRLGDAEKNLWRRPRALPTESVHQPRNSIGAMRLWLVLTGLQIGTWVFQENLESLGAGHQAPLLSLLTGAHWLAPLVQAEVALCGAVIYCLVHRVYSARRRVVIAVERLVARKWTPRHGLLPIASRSASVRSTPLDRWGKQRWQRPPPAAFALI